ncbi:hypothetical protein D9M70_357650 [compost metagenome]
MGATNRLDRVEDAIRTRQDCPGLAIADGRSEVFDGGDGLRVLVREALELHLAAGALVCHESLRNPIPVVSDDLVGRVKNLSVAAVVVAKHHGLRVKLPDERLHSAKSKRRAKSIDALIVVAYDSHNRAGMSMKRDPLVLQWVGVLELVNEEVGEGVRCDRAPLHTLYCEPEHVLEINHAIALQRILIGAVQYRFDRTRLYLAEVRLDGFDRVNCFLNLPVQPGVGKSLR